MWKRLSLPEIKYPIREFKAQSKDNRSKIVMPPLREVITEQNNSKSEEEEKTDNSSIFQGLMREVLETYKPNLLTRRRRLIEDFVRDLMLNNDHIHVVEQQMR